MSFIGMLSSIGSMAYSIASIIPKVFYFLTMSILGIIDLFQMLVRKLAGLDCYYITESTIAGDPNATGTMQTGDIVYQFISGIFQGNYPILSNVFIGLIILGIILLFLSTIIAIIRNEYLGEKDNSKGKIIGQAFKSIIYIAIIPIICIFGVYLANVVLIGIDGATTYNTNYDNTLDKSKLQSVYVTTQLNGSDYQAAINSPEYKNATTNEERDAVIQKYVSNAKKTYVSYNLFGFLDGNGRPFGTTNTTFSGIIFKAAAYGANRIRTEINNPNPNENFGQLLLDQKVTDFYGLFSDASNNLANIAVKIDIAFADNVMFAKPSSLDYTSEYIKGKCDQTGNPWFLQQSEVHKTANRFNIELVWYYYDLWSFNFVIGIGAAIICCTIFVNIIFGLMKRLIELVGLFIMAPPLIALMPLEGGSAYKTWRGSFLSKTLMAYGAIGGMNIVFLILPELQTIKFFNDTFFDGIVDTLLVIIALQAVKDFIALVSKLVGGEDANATGQAVAADLGQNLAKVGKVAMGAAGVGVGGILAGKALVGGIKHGASLINNKLGTNRNPSAEKLDKYADQETFKMKAKHEEEAKAAVKEEYMEHNARAKQQAEDEATRLGYTVGTEAHKEKTKEIMSQNFEENYKNPHSAEYSSAELIKKRLQQKYHDEVRYDANVAQHYKEDRTTFGKWNKGHQERKKESREAHEYIKQTEGNWAAFKDNVGRRFIGNGVMPVAQYTMGLAQPVIKPATTVASEIGGLYSGNKFNDSFAKEGGFQEMALRLKGTTGEAQKKASEAAAKSAEKSAASQRNDAQDKYQEKQIRLLEQILDKVK